MLVYFYRYLPPPPALLKLRDDWVLLLDSGSPHISHSSANWPLRNVQLRHCSFTW
jgi:hypothetical protein